MSWNITSVNSGVNLSTASTPTNAQNKCFSTVYLAYLVISFAHSVNLSILTYITQDVGIVCVSVCLFEDKFGYSSQQSIRNHISDIVYIVIYLVVSNMVCWLHERRVVIRC